MKKLVSIVLISAMFLLTSCTGDTAEDVMEKMPKEEITSTQTSSEEIVSKVPDKTKVEDVVSIKSHELIKNEEGQDLLKVTYTFTNLDEESNSFMMSTVTKAFQDGIQIEKVFDCSLGESKGDVSIQTGKSIDAFELFEVDITKDVDMEVKELFKRTGTIKKTLKLK